MTPLTEQQRFVLRAVKDGHGAWWLASRSGGRQRTITALKRAGYLDWQNRLTKEGDTALMIASPVIDD